MIQHILNDVIKALQGTELLRHVNQDWGQLNTSPPAVDFPCVLVDIGQADYTSTTLNGQQCTATVTLRLADVRYYSQGEVISLGTTTPIFGLYQSINSVLHGHSWGDYARLKRVSLQKNERPDGVREFVITYQTSFTDNTSSTPYTPLKNVQPSIVAI